MSGEEQLTRAPIDNLTAAGQVTADRMVAATGTQLKTSFPARVLEPTWPSTTQDHAAVLELVFEVPFRLENPSSQQVGS